MSSRQVTHLLDAFRAGRREFTRRYAAIRPEHRMTATAPDAWSARDLIAHAAAWIGEANDRIPRLLAGAPSVEYDVDAFNAAAVARAAAWTPDQALAAFRRAADRFEAIVAETDAAEIADSEDAMAWLESIALRVMDEHFADLDRLAGSPTEGEDRSGRP